MKIGTYQFAVSGDMERNFQTMKQAIAQASQQTVRVLAFPECALTGYPPRDIASSTVVDFEKAGACCDEFARLAAQHDMYVIVGTITEDMGKHYNSAIVFAPDGEKTVYNKRALWGWDRDNFCPGNECGVVEIDGVKFGIRICFEVRFPEYFRELYRENTNLNFILFYDVSDWDDTGRYDLIKGHIRTRAVENVCHILSVDAISSYQTAPTGLYDMSGGTVCELERNKEGLLVYDFHPAEMDLGERGRKEISDDLAKRGYRHHG